MTINDYWLNELKKSSELPLNLKIEAKEFPSTIANMYDISYDSLHGERIFGWFLEPKGKETYPLVIDYIGYMNHLDSPLQFSQWLTIGCGVLVADSRGQGGKTLDTRPYETYSESRLMASGFLDKEDFYLRRLYWDALRLVDVAQQLPKVNTESVFIHGTSQGGGIGLFVNSWTSHKITYGFYDVPSHSNLSNRVAEGTGSYGGIQDYIKEFPEQKEMIKDNLTYFDIQFFVHKIENPILVSVGEADPICPKEDFLVAYEKIKGLKELDIYPILGHGGGGNRHMEKILSYILKEIVGDSFERNKRSDL